MTSLFNTSTATVKQSSFIPELLVASGPVDYPLTNDFIFRAVLEANNKALKGLVSSLLHIPVEEIRSAKITNPILLGEIPDDKEYHLDANVLLNDYTLIDLEMQVVWEKDWHNRSLVYLCRNLNNLSTGRPYSDLKPVVHVGILGSAPAEEGTEFYSCNMMVNVKTNKIYSDKVSLHVLNLSQIENATNDDKAWELDRWAKLFKASTWEELKMIARNNEYMTEAANSAYIMNAEDLARKRARDREDYYINLRAKEKKMADMEEALAEKDAALAEQKAALSQKDTALAEKDAALAEQAALIAELQAQLAAKNNVPS